LRVGATAPGSYAIQVEPSDVDLFQTALNEYYRVLSASDDDTRWVPALQRLQKRATMAYLDYLKTVGDTGMEVLCEWTGRGIFVGPDEARRIRARVLRRYSEQLEAPSKITVEGYFRGLSYGGKKGRFDFYDPSERKRYRGKIDESLKLRFENEVSV